MSKYKQLIKQLILFVPQEEIPLKLTFTETLIYFRLQCVGFGWGAGFFPFQRQPLWEEGKKDKCKILTGLVPPHLPLKINRDSDY